MQAMVYAHNSTREKNYAKEFSAQLEASAKLQGFVSSMFSGHMIQKMHPSRRKTDTSNNLPEC